MGRQIIIQPDEKYAIWSSIVDDFIYTNISTKDEIIEILLAEEKHNITRRVNDEITSLKNKRKYHGQFTKTFEDCIEIIKDEHGEDADTLLSLKSLIKG